MHKTNAELEELVMDRGCFSKEENKRIFNAYFKDWYGLHKPIFKKFGISEKERILDIGCAYGMNLIHFDESSLGVEFNPDIVKFARGIGLNVLRRNVEENFGIGRKEKFDTVWCTDFIVHLTSPYAFLLQVREFMHEDSKLIIQIPQYTPFIPQQIRKTYVSPTHYYAFNWPTLKYLVESSGFRIIKSSGFVRHFPGLLNSILDPFLANFGPNIWICAKKGDLVHSTKQKTLPKKIGHLFSPSK